MSRPGLRGVIIYSKPCVPENFVCSFPEKKNAGGPNLKSLFWVRVGAGIAEKFPFPEIEKVNRTGSPRETFSESIEEEVLKVPIAPEKDGGLPFIGRGRISISLTFELTLIDSSLPKPKKGSLKNGLLKGEVFWLLVLIRTFEW